MGCRSSCDFPDEVKEKRIAAASIRSIWRPAAMEVIVDCNRGDCETDRETVAKNSNEWETVNTKH